MFAQYAKKSREENEVPDYAAQHKRTWVKLCTAHEQIARLTSSNAQLVEELHRMQRLVRAGEWKRVALVDAGTQTDLQDQEPIVAKEDINNNKEAFEASCMDTQTPKCYDVEPQGQQSDPSLETLSETECTNLVSLLQAHGIFDLSVTTMRSFFDTRTHLVWPNLPKEAESEFKAWMLQQNIALDTVEA